MNAGGFICFVSSLFCFWLYIRNAYGLKRRKKPKTATAAATPTTPPRNDWKTPERQALENDYSFYNTRYHTLETMLDTAIAAERKTRAKLDEIYDLNQYGAVVADRVVKRFESELYTAQQKRLRIENQLHTARRGRDKALREMVK